ncbi:MAG: methylenetetrahydrofolate reductase [Thermodesulfobacteriota bacterium]|nr:methylenetetrahydrofolate reductase [Thermodesulfobacteriota bacterium]
MSDLIEKNKRPVVSFEFFPPRDEQAAEKLDSVIDRLASLNPDFVSVTFGAGGSTREGSYHLARKLIQEKGLDVITYFAGYGLGPNDITSVLDKYAKLGVETLFVVRGDKPRNIDGFTPHPESFQHASQLLDFITSSYAFCLGAAGYPEGHPEAPSKEKDLEYLRLKVNNGARFIIAQYCYDNESFFDFVQRARAIGITVPIIPGIMPIYSVKLMEGLAKVCGATIPDALRDKLAQLPQDDPKACVRYGIDFATNQCRDLLKHGVDGLHFYTMDRSNTIIEVVNRLRKEALL